jgi:hypothetical protein
MVLGTASAVAAAAGTFFGTRKQECQGEFTPWSPCVGECDEVPIRSRRYVITAGAPACPYIDGYTETEECEQITPCCELVRDWEDPADVPCESGLKKFTRELKENKEGACAAFDTERYAPCCDIIGQWEPVGECGDIKPGQQKYTKDHLGECRSEDVEKFENCAPCVEGWDQLHHWFTLVPIQCQRLWFLRGVFQENVENYITTRWNWEAVYQSRRHRGRGSVPGATPLL